MKTNVYLKCLVGLVLVTVLLFTSICAFSVDARPLYAPQNQEIYFDHEEGGFYVTIPQDQGWIILETGPDAITVAYSDSNTNFTGVLKIARGSKNEDPLFDSAWINLEVTKQIILEEVPSATIEEEQFFAQDGYNVGSLLAYSPNYPDLQESIRIYYFVIEHPSGGIVEVYVVVAPASSWDSCAETVKAIAKSIHFPLTEIPTDTPVPPTETPTPTATPTSTPIFQEGETFYDHPEGGFYITFPQEFCMDMGEEKLDFSEGSIAAISSGCLRGDAILGFAFARIPFSATPNLVDISDWAAAIKSYSTETGKAEGNTDFFLSNGYNAVSLEFFYPQDSGDLEVYWFVIEHPNNGVVLLLAAIDPATSWNNPDVAEIVKNIARSIRPISEIRTQVFLLLLQNEDYSLQAQENIKIF